MLLKFFFSRMSLAKQVTYLKKNGIVLGTRLKDSRQVHIYMLKDFFIEVVYKNDNMEGEAETLTMLRGLENLNQYLEREFRASF